MAKIDKILSGTNSDQFLAALGVQPSSAEERGQILEQLTQHFDALILETVASSLEPGERVKFQQLLRDDPDRLEEWLAETTSHVPGLAKKIDAAIVAEIEAIRTAKTKIS